MEAISCLLIPDSHKIFVNCNSFELKLTTVLNVMKRLDSVLILSLILGLSPYLSYGQSCADGRFSSELFSTLKETKGIEYGKNKQPSNTDPDAEQTLFLDVYEPENDSMETRPLIIFAFGGAFVTGSREADDVVTICQRYARMGYVTASIDYRTSPQIIFSPSDKNIYLAVIKATHDMRAAIRFFRKNVIEEGNSWKIDTSLIFAGGVSAGGIAALHTAYLDELSELPSEVLNDTTGIGGLEGLSGNPGYSSKVEGIISLCGALGDTLWLNAGDIPVVSVHGTEDDVVPYGSSAVTVFGGNTQVDGSASIALRAESVGISHGFYSFQGAGHTPFIKGFESDFEAYMDTTVEFTSSLVANWVCAALSTPVEAEKQFVRLKAFPNPFKDVINIDYESDIFTQQKPVLRDLQGRVVQADWIQIANGFILKRGNIPAGLYLLQVVNKDGVVIGNLRIVAE